MRIRRLAHDIPYALKTALLRRELPYMFGFQPSDECNLDCFYCEGKNLGKVRLTYGESIEVLTKAYGRGHRSLYFTGGEPMLWRDGGKSLTDLVAHARSLGFFDVAVVTNGTRPLSIPGVSYLVSIDGPRFIHDEIRGGTYDLIIENARRSESSRVFASITLNRRNLAHLREFVREIASTGIFRGIVFTTLTHWPEIVEKYGLGPDERAGAVDTLWELKKQGYPVILSRAARRAFKANDWKRPIRQIEIAVGREVYTCCRDVGSPEICAQCGYLGCIEISQILALKASALFEMLKLS